MKFNVDGASKGNPGVAGFGGVLRDDHGCILSIFHCHLGSAINNFAELMALDHFLEFLKQNNQFVEFAEISRILASRTSPSPHAKAPKEDEKSSIVPSA